MVDRHQVGWRGHDSGGYASLSYRTSLCVAASHCGDAGRVLRSGHADFGHPSSRPRSNFQRTPSPFFLVPKKIEEHSTEADAWPNRIEFEYINAFHAEPTNTTFLVKVKSSDQKLVVKFVDRYGVEAHQLLADAVMALRLLYCGLLDGKNDARNVGSGARGDTKRDGLYVGPMRMVIMEYIEGTTEQSAWPENAQEKIERVVQKLHVAQLVFGDLRASNILFAGDNPFFINFSWAWKVNEARYTRNLSRSVKWPGKAEELEMKPILTDHDWFMLGQLFSAE